MKTNSSPKRCIVHDARARLRHPRPNVHVNGSETLVACKMLATCLTLAAERNVIHKFAGPDAASNTCSAAAAEVDGCDGAADVTRRRLVCSFALSSSR